MKKVVSLIMIVIVGMHCVFSLDASQQRRGLYPSLDNLFEEANAPEWQEERSPEEIARAQEVLARYRQKQAARAAMSPEERAAQEAQRARRRAQFVDYGQEEEKDYLTHLYETVVEPMLEEAKEEGQKQVEKLARKGAKAVQSAVRQKIASTIAPAEEEGEEAKPLTPKQAVKTGVKALTEAAQRQWARWRGEEVPATGEPLVTEKGVVHKKIVLGDVTYNCEKKRVKLAMGKKQKKYFNDVDSYEYSPTRQYVLLHATEPASVSKAVVAGTLPAKVKSILPMKRTSTQVVSTITGDTIVELNDLVTYEFSPDEKTLLVLMPGGSLLAGEETTHRDTSGKVRKGAEVFEYRLLDFNKKKWIKVIKNATSVTFISPVELQIIYENKTQHIVPIGSKSVSAKHTGKSVRFAEYVSASKTLKMKTSKGKKSFKDVVSYAFTPKKRFIVVHRALPLTQTERFSSGITSGITEEVISGKRIVMQVINAKTGEYVKTRAGKELVFENIVTYTFSPDETRLLVRLHKMGCKYMFFDLEQQLFIPQPIQSARSVTFKSDNKFRIIGKDNKKRELPIMLMQRTWWQRFSGQ